MATTSSNSAGPTTDRAHHRGAEGPRKTLEPAPLWVTSGDPSTTDPRQRGEGQARAGSRRAAVEWVRPTDLAVRVAARVAAGAVTAGLAWREQRRTVRRELTAAVHPRRERLAPAAAFGAHAEPEAATRTAMSR